MSKNRLLWQRVLAPPRTILLALKQLNLDV
jgi:hypothetical protein